MKGLSARLKEWAQGQGWTVEKKRAYGEYNGFLFTASGGRGFLALALPARTWRDEDRKAVRDFLKTNRRKLKLREFSVDNNKLQVKMVENFRSITPDAIEDMLDNLTDFLRQRPLPGSDVCCLCGQPRPDQHVAMGDIVSWAHASCCESNSRHVEKARREYEMESKNYTLGVIGALAGGLIAAIPWIVVQIFLNRMAALLGYLVGLGAWKGYSLLRGRMGPATRWIVAASTMVVVAAAEVVIVAYYMYDADIPVDISTLRLVFGLPDFLRSWAGDLGLALLMALLGVAPLFTRLKGGARDVLPTVEKLEL